MSEEILTYFNGDELSASVWAGKYQMKQNGVPKEATPDDMHRRMAKEFARIEENYQDRHFLKDTAINHLSEFGKQFVKEKRNLNEDSIYEYFKDFRDIIPQGSIMSILGNKYKVGSLSNCFVVPPPFDSYGGIMHTDEHLAQLMKRRGGVGTNLNYLRFSEAPVFNAAESSTGIPSWASRYSNTTREVAQDGRRGALMLMLLCCHPDIFNFVKMKDDRTKVTGANVSVMLTKAFMECVERDSDFICRFPVDTSFETLTKMEGFYDLEYNKLKTLQDGITVMKIHAKELFDLIIEMAWKNGEPGLAFMDAIWGYSPDGVYEVYRAIASNPCGEQWLQAYDSCRLMALNLFSIVVNPFLKNAIIDYDKLYEISYIQQRLADDLVDLEIEYIKKIITKIVSDPEPDEIKATELNLWKNILKTAQAGRRTGCGFTALADMLAAINVKYDSKEGMEIIKQVCKCKMQAELDCTIDLAILRGTFEGWDWIKEYQSKTISKGKVILNNPGNAFYKALFEEFPEQAIRMWTYGRRNVSWSTVAPTGSLSIIAKLIEYFNVSAGMEPQYSLFHFRNKKINPSDKNARVNFIDQNGDSWQQYPVIMGAFKDWFYTTQEEQGDLENMSPAEIKALYEKSPWFGSTANDIDWKKRVEIQAIIQRYTTNAVSSTVNLPEDVSKDVVNDIYWAAYKAGLKGITVYRDKSRTGVLVNEAVSAENFAQHEAPKRPQSLDASIFHLKVRGQDYTVAVGELNSKPYEIFATEGKALDGCDRGQIWKKGKGRYHFVCQDIDEAIAENMTDEQAAITRLASTALRHGTSVEFLVSQLNKTKGDMTSFSKAIARTLKHYIKEGTIAKGTCNECGSINLVYQEGCLSCKDCGNSKCGG